MLGEYFFDLDGRHFVPRRADDVVGTAQVFRAALIINFELDRPPESTLRPRRDAEALVDSSK